MSLDHFWSLAVEEQFYLIWPMAVFILRDLKRLLLTCVALSFAALLLRFVLATHNFAYHTINRNTLCRMDALLIGAALALLLRSEFQDVVSRSAKKLFFAVVAVVGALNVTGLLVRRYPDWRPVFDVDYLSVRYTLMALGSAALVAWCLQPSSLMRRAFENRTLRFFGKYSYGLYVLHYVALGFLIRTFRGWIGELTLNKGVQVVGAGCASFVIAVTAAVASYNLYEKQFLRLKRYFDYERPVKVAGQEAEIVLSSCRCPGTQVWYLNTY